LPELATASDEFVWVTGPSLPGLSMRITTFTFVGATWVEVAAESAVCFVGALCAAVCDCPDPAAGQGSGWVPAVWVCELCWLVVLALLAVLEAAPELCWAACALPAPAFVGAWVEVADAPVFWSVEATCTVDCDCPALDPPPLCTCVLVWLVELSLLTDAEEVFELVCSAEAGSGESSAAAVPTCAKLNRSARMHDSNAKQHLRGRNIPAPSAIAVSRGRRQVAGFRSPHSGGGIYHPGMSTRVLLVEPNRIVREGIRAQLARNGAEIAEAGTGAEAIAAAGERRPAVVVLDSRLPDASAAEICEALTELLPSTPIIVLSELGDESSVAAAVDAGARAYLLKDADDLDLAAAVERVLAGESVIDPRAAAALIDSRRGAGDPTLSRQELKVLRLVAEGLTNPEIGTRLFLSRHTVKEYLSHVMRKLEVGNRIEAVRRATELGLIEGVARSASDAPANLEETLAYNESGERPRGSDLKVTPLKIDQLRALRREP
jgi:DNA-binding NarL/FixJ family response regulator